MYELKLHPKVEDDLKELDNALRIQVFKKINKFKILQNSDFLLEIRII